MVRVPLDEAILLLEDWKERALWLGAAVFLREDMSEEHKFWARAADVSPEKLVLAGEHALLEAAFEPSTVFEYSEISEAPPELRERFSGFEFCLTIRSHSVLALLFGERPKKD